MKTRKDLASPWGVRLYFEESEFETMMADVLFRAGPEAFIEGRGVDVDLVLFKVYGLEADYIDLPHGVLGRTLFRRDGSAQIEVSRRLADVAEADQLARRRLRTTLAHEGGHVTCHRQLFISDTDSLSLFGDELAEPEKPAILCRESILATSGYQGEWWEFQANRCMASLLLPKHILIPRVNALLGVFGVSDFAQAQQKGMDEEFIRSLSNTFDVSWQAVLLRLQELGFVPKAEELQQGKLDV